MECHCGNKGKYKCPKCLERYCSLDCAKLHKIHCIAVEKPEKPLKVVKHPPRNFLLEEEDEDMLADEELSEMSKKYTETNSKLLKLLKYKSIQKILTEIDLSENRLGALRSVLMQDKEGVSSFSECLDEMLKSLGYLDANGVSIL